MSRERDDRRDDRDERSDKTREPVDKAAAQPSHIAYSVRQAENGKSYFNRVGAAFAHKDGQGHNIELEATPVNGRVVLRTPKDRLDEMRDEQPRDRDDRGRDEKDRGR